MAQFSQYSDDQLSNMIVGQPAPIAQAMIAELKQRNAEKANRLLSGVHEEIKQTRQELAAVRAELPNVHVQLKELGKSHRIHVWILVVAIMTAAFALIDALHAIFEWFPKK
jgi:hypothetical protein